MQKVLNSARWLPFVLHDWAFIYGRPIAGVVFAAFSRISFALGLDSAAVRQLLTAVRLTDGKRFSTLLRSHSKQILFECCVKGVERTRHIAQYDRRCLVLALPLYGADGVLRRKGVVLISFTETAMAVLQCLEIRALVSLFHVVLEPSWAGYADPAILGWSEFDEPVIVQATEERDRVLLDLLGSSFKAVPYGAGDWIDAETFVEPSPLEKRYGAICVANFRLGKRAHVFLRAVAECVRHRPKFRAALVLANLGKGVSGAKRISDLIDSLAIQQCVDVYVGIGQKELITLYCESKVCVLPSLKEGSNRAIFEAMCCNVPVIVLDRNIGVNKNYVNEHTGQLVSESELPVAILNAEKLSDEARTWFQRNLGPINTRRKLAADLNRCFPGENWTEHDLALKVNRPEAQYAENVEPFPLVSEILAGSQLVGGVSRSSLGF